MNSPTCESLGALLSDGLAGELTAEVVVSVEAHLAECAGCRLLADALFWQDRVLAELAASKQLPQLRQGIRNALIAEAHQSARRPRWSRFVVAASVLLAGLLGWWFIAQPVQPLAVARLDQFQGEVYVIEREAKTAAQAGQSLYAGQSLSVGEEGQAVVSLADATRLELGAATTVNWLTDAQMTDGGSRIFLAEGVLTADGTELPGRPPMVLATPHAQIVVQGNKVNLVHAADSTRIELEQGTAQVVRKSDGQVIQMRPGAFAVAAAAEQAFAAQPLPPRHTTARTTLKGHTAAVSTLAYSTNGRLVSGANNGSVIVWNQANGQPLHTFQQQKGNVRALALTADDRLLAAVADDRTLKLWNLADGEPLNGPQGNVGQLFALHFADDGKTLTTCSYDRLVRRWDMASGQLKSTTRLQNYRSDFDFPASMAFSADGSELAWGLKDNTARLWELATAREQFVLRGHEGAVTALAFSPDGKTLATGSRDRTCKLWNLETGQLLATLRGHRHTVQAAAFSPDGRTLATGGSDTVLKLWQLPAGVEIATFQGHSKAVSAVAFTSDGRTLVSGSADTTLKVWDVPQAR